MVHEKYIKINGKTYGPYYYESYRENGKVKKRYVKIPEKNTGLKCRVKKISSIFLAIVLIFGFVFVGFLYFSGFELTGFVISEQDGPRIDDFIAESIENDLSTVKSEMSEDVEEKVQANINTKQYGAIIGKPVRWEKNVKLSEFANLSIEIPQDSKNIKITKISVINITEEVVSDEVVSNVSEINESVVDDVEGVDEFDVEVNESVDSGRVLNESVVEEPIKEVEEEKVEEVSEEEVEEPTEQEPEQTEEPAEQEPEQTEEPAEQEPEQIEEPQEETESESEPAKEPEEVTVSLTGNVLLEYSPASKKDGFLVRFFKKIMKFTGFVVVVEDEEIENAIVLNIDEVVEEVVIEYETNAPESYEREIAGGREIVISGPDDLHYENVLSYTELENQVVENEIKLYHVVDNVREVVDFDAYDLDENDLIDYIEWIVPSLSNQTYELIIEITKAEHLDSNRRFVSDVYDFVGERDNTWVLIPNGDYVRVKFETELDSTKDITIYAKSNFSNASVEVYEKDSDVIITSFENIGEDKEYKKYLTGFEGVQDVFDLKVRGGAVEFDYIVDPVVSACVNITSSGVYTLDSSVSDFGGSVCVNITSSNVEFDCQGNTIDGNDVGGSFGVYVEGAGDAELSNVTIKNCVISDFERSLYFLFTNSSFVKNSTLNSSDNGLWIHSSDYNVFSNLTVINNVYDGIYIRQSNFNNFTQGVSSGNLDGVYMLIDGSNNTITGYNITGNSKYEIFISNELNDGNVFYNNFINALNTSKIVAGANNYFNTSLDCTQTNIIGGSCIGGNFWANSSATGYSEVCTDANANGICDVAYNVSSGLECVGCSGFNIDELPLLYASAVVVAPADTGGGGSSRKKETPVNVTEIIKTFNLDKSDEIIQIGQGEIKQIFVNITNPTDFPFIIELSSDFKEFVKFKQDKLALFGKKSELVEIEIVVEEDMVPDTYLGHLIFKSEDVEKQIILSIEVLPAGSLFDIVLEIPAKSRYVLAGESISIDLFLTKLIEKGIEDIEINYSIRDEQGKEIVSYTDTRAVEEELDYVRDIPVPDDLEEGRYVLYTEINYGGKTASSSSWFNVVSKNNFKRLFYIYRYLIIVIVTLLVVVGVLIVVVIKKIEKIRELRKRIRKQMVLRKKRRKRKRALRKRLKKKRRRKK